MDGISGASAVVSLAAQLVKTTLDVIKFLREIRDSPEELRCTIELLDHLWDNLKGAQWIVEQQIGCADQSFSIASISNALKLCESKITLVEQCLNKFKRVLDPGSSIRKKWASFKHVLKKGEIKRLQDQLREAIKELQLALQINSGVGNIELRDVLLANSEKLSTINNNQEEFFMVISQLIRKYNMGSSSTTANFTNVTHVDPAITLNSTPRKRRVPRATSNISENSRNKTRHSLFLKKSNLGSTENESKTFMPESPPQSRVISRGKMLLWPMGILGYVSVQTKWKFVDDAHNAHNFNKRFVSEERIIVLRPSFWKAQLELRLVNSCGRISRTLSIDCVVGFKAPVFDMCRSGDIRGLRDAFYSGSVSLNVVDPLGMGLLHYAAGSFQKDLCERLLSMGVGADRTDMIGNTALTYMGTQSRIDQTSAVTETMTEIARLLLQAQKDMSEFDVSEWFLEYDGPPEGAELILSLDSVKSYIRSPDDSDPLYPALASILRLYAKNPEPWESVILTLLRSGANVHANVRRDLSFLDQSEYLCRVSEYATPLDELFMYTIDPLEGQVAASGWLQILVSEGYDINAYLETESELHARPMQLTIPSRRPMGYETERKLVFDWGLHPTVSWDWWISPSSSTFLLRQEFRLMAIRSLSDDLLIQWSWKATWPVIYPEWSKLNQYCEDASELSRYEELFALANERATDRVDKKARKMARKMARAGRYEGPCKIPGAWPI